MSLVVTIVVEFAIILFIFLKTKRVEKKFFNLLLKVCEKEQIYLEYYKSIGELNAPNVIVVRVGNREKYYDVKLKRIRRWQLARAQYKRLPDDLNTILNRMNGKYPRICLLENEVPYVLAHELGHHFLRGKKHIERDADKYIFKLAKKYLSLFERICISPFLLAWGFGHIFEKT